MNDRRRINGPSSGTAPPIFPKNTTRNAAGDPLKPLRTRRSNALRKMFLKTGVTPSASGSAYLELESPLPYSQAPPSLASRTTSGLKLTCTVHGPRPLPRSAPFTPHIILTTHIKYAPFASRQRRGYVRDISERDLAVHLETALRGVIIGDRWPKSGVEVIITVLEGEENLWWRDNEDGAHLAKIEQLGMMSVLSGCITVAAAAIADAGIDCVDMVSGGVAALVRGPSSLTNDSEVFPQPQSRIVLDPVPSEHTEILAACVVGYLPSRDEITDIWVRGGLRSSSGKNSLANDSFTYDQLADSAVQAALGSHQVLVAAMKEAVDMSLKT